MSESPLAALLRVLSGPRPFEQQDVVGYTNTGRPILRHGDEGFATELSATVGEGPFLNIPTIWDGAPLSEDAAILRAKQAEQGGALFPRFDTIDSAVAAAQERSRNLGKLLEFWIRQGTQGR